jgi:hypothetical protein
MCIRQTRISAPSFRVPRFTCLSQHNKLCHHCTGCDRVRQGLPLRFLHELLHVHYMSRHILSAPLYTRSYILASVSLYPTPLPACLLEMSQIPVPTALTQLPLEDGDRPRYSDTQLKEYFGRIRLPQKYLDSPIFSNKSLALTKQYGFPFLQALTRCHTCEVPFENLRLHYSANKTVTLDTADLFTNIVTRRHGGRCMENNTFLATVLRSLGFYVRNCGGRVSRAMSPYPDVRKNQAATYDGWNHMLNLVRLDSQWYVVDVGMGAMGPNIPYPLQDGFEITSIAARRIRIQSRAISESYNDHSNKM